jgi:surfactin synthase thioesterase subunit
LFGESIYSISAFESKLFLSSLIRNRDSDFFDHIIQIGITSTEFSADPVASSLGNLPTSNNDIELTGPTRCKDRIHVESSFYECHETRDFGFIITSRGTVDDFNFHSNSSIDECSSPVAHPTPCEGMTGCGKPRHKT